MPDTYVEEAMFRGSQVTVFTTNGYQLRGVILHDSLEYIVLLSNGKNKMIYKHAISTIEPA